jgi:soluble lytic murein transglycosylase-like protein
VAAALALAAGTATVGLLREDEPPPAPDAPPGKSRPGAPPFDTDAFEPFAYTPSADRELLLRGSRGNAHVIYALSPGGVQRSVARARRWRDAVDFAVVGSDVDPDRIEAMMFLESAGRPAVMADGTPNSATGLMQILPSTATSMLGMNVDLGRSLEIQRALALNRRRAVTSRRARKRRAARARVRALVRERRRVDERFDVDASLEGAVRYLESAYSRFGRWDLATVSYHMGIGNLESVIERFVAPRRPAGSTRATVRRYGITWPRLYYGSSPTRNPRTWGLLTSLGDDSRHYLFKVVASEEIMRLGRTDRGELRERITRQTAKASAEEVLRPRARYQPYEDHAALRRAYDAGELVPLPGDPRRLAYSIDRRMGGLARRLKQPRILYRGLRREALACLLYIAQEYRRIRGRGTLRVTSTVRDLPYQSLLVATNAQATRRFSLHTTGFAIDIAKPRVEWPLRFLLERLQSLNAISWVEEPGAFHLTVGPEAEPLMPLYEALVVDRRPVLRQRPARDRPRRTRPSHRPSS